MGKVYTKLNLHACAVILFQMSAEKLLVKEPFAKCKNCPLTRHVIIETKNTNPFRSNQTKLVKIQVICTIDNGVAHLGGLRVDSRPKAGVFDKHDPMYEVNNLPIIAGSPPDFCPQLKK